MRLMNTRHGRNVERMARGLGWFSVALGLGEILAPRTLSSALGMDRPGLVRAFGLRELATGLGILALGPSSTWLWGRVAGDMLDLGTLGSAAHSPSRKVRRNAVAAIAAVAGVTLLDLISARQLADWT